MPLLLCPFVLHFIGSKGWLKGAPGVLVPFPLPVKGINTDDKPGVGVKQAPSANVLIVYLAVLAGIGGFPIAYPNRKAFGVKGIERRLLIHPDDVWHPLPP